MSADAPADRQQQLAEESSPGEASETAVGLDTSRWARAKGELRRITLNFTPSWFSVNMGTGITSILLHELPYQFRGLGIIANIIFALNVLLFLVFLTISIARYTIWPTMLPTMLYHPSQALFLGTFAMGFATIVNMCALSAVPAWGSGFATFTWVLWWIDSVISVAICMGLPFLQFTRHTQSLDQITGIWLLPVVSPIVSAASGGILAQVLSPEHARLTIIVSYIQWGMGFGLALMIMALYYARLAIYKIPPATIIVSAFLPLGPCGQGAFAILKLSSSLYQLSKAGQGGLSTQDDAALIATAIYGVSIPIALAIWGLGLFWLVLAAWSLFDLWLVSALKFNIGWWGFTFPLGVFCTATTQFGKELDSTGFKVLGTVLSVIEVVLWLFIAGRTFFEVMRGNIFFSPCLSEVGGSPPKTLPNTRKYHYEPR